MDSSQPDSTKKKVLSVSAAVRLTNSILHEHTFIIEGEVSELNNKPGYTYLWEYSISYWHFRWRLTGVKWE